MSDGLALELRAAAERLCKRELGDFQGPTGDDADMRAAIMLARHYLEHCDPAPSEGVQPLAWLLIDPNSRLSDGDRHLPLYAADVLRGDERETEYKPCSHNWVSARNEVVTSGEVCTECGAIRADGDPAPSDGETQDEELPHDFRDIEEVYASEVAMRRIQGKQAKKITRMKEAIRQMSKVLNRRSVKLRECIARLKAINGDKDEFRKLIAEKDAKLTALRQQLAAAEAALTQLRSLLTKARPGDGCGYAAASPPQPPRTFIGDGSPLPPGVWWANDSFFVSHGKRLAVKGITYTYVGPVPQEPSDA